MLEREFIDLMPFQDGLEARRFGALGKYVARLELLISSGPARYANRFESRA
jgi:hypothetical protein